MAALVGDIIIGGIGGSVIATVLVSFAGPAGDPVYQTFLRLGVAEFYPDRNQFPKHRWVGWLGEAKHECVLLGQAHGEWCTDRGFARTLTERVQAGVKVEIFFLDPTGSAARVRHNEDRQRVNPLLTRIRASIKVVWEIREAIEAVLQERLRLYVYNATPSLGLTWIDDTMLVTHYLAVFINLTSPLLRVDFRPTSSTLFGVYSENVNEIRDHFSTELTRENIAQYLPEEANA